MHQCMFVLLSVNLATYVRKCLILAPQQYRSSSSQHFLNCRPSSYLFKIEKVPFSQEKETLFVLFNGALKHYYYWVVYRFICVHFNLHQYESINTSKT